MSESRSLPGKGAEIAHSLVKREGLIGFVVVVGAILVGVLLWYMSQLMERLIEIQTTSLLDRQEKTQVIEEQSEAMMEVVAAQEKIENAIRQEREKDREEVDYALKQLSQSARASEKAAASAQTAAQNSGDLFRWVVERAAKIDEQNIELQKQKMLLEQQQEQQR